MQAIASKVETLIQGIFFSNAKPLTVATPILTPVKEPGPAVTAIASSSSTVCSPITLLIIGKSVSLCVRPAFTNSLLITLSPSVNATEAVTAEESTDKIIILPLIFYTF